MNKNIKLNLIVGFLALPVLIFIGMSSWNYNHPKPPVEIVMPEFHFDDEADEANRRAPGEDADLSRQLLEANDQ